MHGRVIVDNTLLLAQMALYAARFASQTQKLYLTNLRKHVCQLILVCSTHAFKQGQLHHDHSQSVEAVTMARVQSQHGLEKSVCSFSVILARHWASKSCSQSMAIQSVHEISSCLLLLLCSLLLLCALALLLAFAVLFAFMVHREKCLKLVHRSLVSLSLCNRLDVHDQQ